MICALVTAGIEAGYLTSARLARVHWQAGDRPPPAPAVSVAGESGLWVDPAEIPSGDDIARLGRALADGALGERDALMAHVAASRRPAPSRRPGATRSGWSSPAAGAGTGVRRTSTAGSCSPPTCRPGGATPTATARGPGAACGTCSAPPPCSPGNSTPPTSPAWPATPTTASPSTCTSAPPPASWTAHEPPPNNQPAAGNLQILDAKGVANVVVEILQDPEPNADLARMANVADDLRVARRTPSYA
jgi:hypothetical protein